MEVQHFDKDGNQIDKNHLKHQEQKKSFDNNPKIIHHNRLDDIPVVRLGLNEPVKQEKMQSTAFMTESSIQTKITKEKSKYEIDENTTFTIHFGVMFNEEQIIIIPQSKFEDVDKIDANLYEKHWVKFRLWNFLESMHWKQECMEFLPQHRIFNLNINKFNELKVRRLLLDWSFKEYGDNHKLFHVNKQLTDESMNLFFKSFNPNIIQYVLNKMNENLGE